MKTRIHQQGSAYSVIPGTLEMERSVQADYDLGVGEACCPQKSLDQALSAGTHPPTRTEWDWIVCTTFCMMQK